MKDNKKKIIIISSIVALILVVVAVVLLVLNKEEAYRIIKVYEVEGDAYVNRKDVGEIDVYPNMVLQSGDEICLNTGKMTLKLDDDKYVYVEPDTKFSIVATGSKEDSKTTINLTQGAITNDIQNKLSDSSSYEINTPNSNMAVRGTTYRVCVYEEDDVLYTRVSVFDGAVSTQLVYNDGKVGDEDVMVPGGKEVIIYYNTETTDYLDDVKEIDYSTLPEDVKKLIEQILPDIVITTTETTEEPGPFEVTFMYNGSVFGSQTVEKGELATVPSLMPASSGKWDFDFQTPIKEDTVIEWR